ncbi:DUF4382 domain-containing protein [Planktothrix paucivesiculata]|uniref:DUF4382 domain-containing protein n=1 Tax=Planktothrix paucivesiculata PCC 9631 TaxID=671071 RepID=A0A7Z9E402_9CYAN|nr:DUF4382 domain-containing protein [Planktothrix paucivesiculata]VXD24306.1 conserved exported hypothetical protein [Planktothrix paucivesiculata PCC 9631]
MKKQQISLISLIIASLMGCSQPETPQVQNTPNIAQTGEIGTVKFQANGKDFVRKGLVSKDGWTIKFDHVYVNFVDAMAYQADPPYNAETGTQPNAKTSISLVVKKIVDLAEGDDTAQPIIVNEVPAPAGKYNAISWNLRKGIEGAIADQVMVIEGVATKGDKEVPFVLKFDREMQFICGDYVGEEPKGILQPGGTTNLEATFHFDYLFGDENKNATEKLNSNALGFEPLAAMAENGQLVADLSTLKQKLSEADYQKLIEILSNIAQVGEGDCKAVTSNP